MSPQQQEVSTVTAYHMRQFAGKTQGVISVLSHCRTLSVQQGDRISPGKPLGVEVQPNAPSPDEGSEKVVNKIGAHDAGHSSTASPYHRRTTRWYRNATCTGSHEENCEGPGDKTTSSLPSKFDDHRMTTKRIAESTHVSVHCRLGAMYSLTCAN